MLLVKGKSFQVVTISYNEKNCSWQTPTAVPLYYNNVYLLANLVRTLRDNYWINLRCVTIFSCELSCNIFNEFVVDVVLNQVDGAATEATTHDETIGLRRSVCWVAAVGLLC